MRTAFGRWLEKRGENHFAYAVRVGMNRTRVALLAGVSREPFTIIRWHMPSLTVISKETGISVARLIEDAARAAANPRAPRQYNRKGTVQGERADA